MIKVTQICIKNISMLHRERKRLKKVKKKKKIDE